MRFIALLFTLGVIARGAAPGALPPVLLLDGAMAGPTIVVVGERGAVFRSTDEARTWRPALTPSRATLTGVSFALDGKTGWAVGHDAIILATTNAGETWTRQFQGENLQDSFLDVLALSDTQALAVGAYGLGMRTLDGGKTWARQKIIAEDHHLNRISRGPTGTLYLAGERGVLLRSADQGESWTPIPTPYTGSFYGVLPLDRRTLLAYGLRGRVYRSIDDGAGWQLIETPEPTLVATAACLRGNTILLGGSGRAVWRSADYGKTIVPSAGEKSGFTGAIAEMLELPNGAVLTLGEAGAALHPR
jgi:photosystem II stability/assembly factor-like uncharacterized protein